MKIFALVLLCLLSPQLLNAESKEINKNHEKLEAALAGLDSSDILIKKHLIEVKNFYTSLSQKVTDLGYFLCVKFSKLKKSCQKSSTMGYALCVQKTGLIKHCAKDGSIGYGLCVQKTGFHSLCDKNGSIGYGLCVQKTGSFHDCNEDASVAYAQCLFQGNDQTICDAKFAEINLN